MLPLGLLRPDSISILSLELVLYAFSPPQRALGLPHHGFCLLQPLFIPFFILLQPLELVGSNFLIGRHLGYVDIYRWVRRLHPYVCHNPIPELTSTLHLFPNPSLFKLDHNQIDPLAPFRGISRLLQGFFILISVLGEGREALGRWDIGVLGIKGSQLMLRALLGLLEVGGRLKLCGV